MTEYNSVTQQYEYYCQAFNKTEAKIKCCKSVFSNPEAVSIRFVDCVIIDSGAMWEQALSQAHPPQ